MVENAKDRQRLNWLVILKKIDKIGPMSQNFLRGVTVDKYNIERLKDIRDSNTEKFIFNLTVCSGNIGIQYLHISCSSRSQFANFVECMQ